MSLELERVLHLLRRTSCLACKQSRSRPIIHCRGLHSHKQSQNKAQEFDNNTNKSPHAPADNAQINYDEIKCPKSKDNVYIIKPRVVDKLLTHLPDHDFKIFEVNAGSGIITRELLNKRREAIKVFEINQEFLKNLEQLQEEFGEKRLQIYPINMFNVPRLFYRDKLSSNKNFEKIYEGMIPRKWEEDPPVVVIGAIPSAKTRAFLNKLLYEVCYKSESFPYGRIEFMLFIPHRHYKIITASQGSKDYQGLSVGYNLFFDVQLLSEEPLSSFSRLYRQNVTIMRKMYDVDHLYLVRIIPKKELSFKLPDQVEMLELGIFIRQNFIKKSAFIISKLDTSVPNCGHKLIKLGYTTTCRFADLNPDQILALFQEISSWPEYYESPFRKVVQSMMVDTTTQ